ncbi:unnamed protein product, partial [Meganyctiphanes norvegica]
MPPKKRPKVKRRPHGSNVFDLFTQRQVAEFKAGFQLLDHNKDGKISADDLDWAFKHVGKSTSEEEIQSMIADSPIAINFTMLMKLFADKASGEQDDDEVVIKAFKTFSNDKGLINAENLRVNLANYGDRYTNQEADDFIGMMPVDANGFILCDTVCKMLTGPAEDEAQEEEAATEEASS